MMIDSFGVKFVKIFTDSAEPIHFTLFVLSSSIKRKNFVQVLTRINFCSVKWVRLSKIDLGVKREVL